MHTSKRVNAKGVGEHHKGVVRVDRFGEHHLFGEHLSV